MPKEKDESSVVKEDAEGNITESPKTGNIVNIIIGALLVITLIILFYFKKKYNKD